MKENFRVLHCAVLRLTRMDGSQIHKDTLDGCPSSMTSALTAGVERIRCFFITFTWLSLFLSLSCDAAVLHVKRSHSSFVLGKCRIMHLVFRLHPAARTRLVHASVHADCAACLSVVCMTLLLRASDVVQCIM